MCLKWIHPDIEALSIMALESLFFHMGRKKSILFREQPEIVHPGAIFILCSYQFKK